MITENILTILDSCLTSEQFVNASKWAEEVATKQFQVGNITSEELSQVLSKVGQSNFRGNR